MKILNKITDTVIGGAVDGIFLTGKVALKSAQYVGKQVVNHEKVKPLTDDIIETAGVVGAATVVGSGVALTAACWPVGLALAPEIAVTAAAIHKATRKSEK